MRLNLGCGNLKFSGFDNVDYPIVDLRSQLPYEDESATDIRLIHVIEHLRRDQAVRCIRECWRVIQVGGKLHIEFPDLEKCFDIAKSHDELCAYIYGDPDNSESGNELEYHRWGWTERSLTLELLGCGFQRVEGTDGGFHGRGDRDITLIAVK